MENILNSQPISSAIPEESAQLRKSSGWLSCLFVPLAAAIITFCATWIQIEDQIFTYRFFWWKASGGTVLVVCRLGIPDSCLSVPARSEQSSLGSHPWHFYFFVSIPAVICYYEAALHGEPFLPWDLARQVRRLMSLEIGLWI